MKARWLLSDFKCDRAWLGTLIAAMVLFAALSGASWAIENPLIKNPVVSGSSSRSGLIRSPNPIDSSSNLVITGNISGGRYFRGVVPYRATSDFGAPLGSSSLDSFLRDSAGLEDFGRYSGKYRPRPYYSPSGTVTTTRAGHSGVFRPPTAYIRGRAAGGTTLPTLPKGEGWSRWDTAAGQPRTTKDVWEPVSNIRFRPMSIATQELEKALSRQVEKYAQGMRLTAEQRQKQVEQFQRDLKQVRDKAAELKQSLTGQDDSLWLSTPSEPSEGVWQSQRIEKVQTPKQQTSRDKQIDVYEQMKQQIGDFREISASRRAKDARQTKEAVDGEQRPSKRSFQKKSPLSDELSDVDLSVRAKSILGEHKTFASFSKDKFNQHLRAGEDYLKQGKYYRAADAYTLASIYKPGDPLAYAGKSHALFAAGEYMSSALFLSRALGIFPEYARFKIDIEAMVGDRDKLESRVADIEQWLERNDAGELWFLLSYVYYQMGRLERAEKAIEAAYEKMPESPAVVALRKAIDEFVGRRAH